MRKRVAIDLVPVRVGEGGTGSGVWTYARELLFEMDQAIPDGVEILCLANSGQLPFLHFKHIRVVRIPFSGGRLLGRLAWIHFFLPLFCLFARVNLLHKLATETPFFCPTARVTTIHDFYYEYLLENQPPESIRIYERLENLYFSFITKCCFKKSNALIAVSQATLWEAVDRYPSASGRINVVHHGSSEKQVLPQKISLERFDILCVAKFMEHKGQHLLISAVETLLNQNPALSDRVHLELRGFQNDKNYYDRICEQIKKSPFSKQIKIRPFCSTDLLEDIYRGASLVVLLSSYEGFGLPVLEAQGFGIPVLCSNLPVLQEVGGEGACYVDCDKTQQIVDALQKFIQNESFINEIRERARVNTARFSWKWAAAQTLDVYGSCW